ncbi:hypothetical protein GAO09_15265 [Rhizobiales bacterium RZME27]|uniref:Uncharacterized protein n=1 Tax=Endobacterium cereale TaxID=2663029 RepID=A0A6A8A803_9HYPH|nr:hypothetical protein [Endobacterium cereale]MEB2843385.1 hypothetical protein [Endobacterium cereale]MQY47395.1 hypothetical protein [Endobacterium cereale]
MSDGRFSFPACVIAGKRRLDVDDLMMLRKHAFSDGIRTEDDARLLLAIHRACSSSCPQWDCYLIESIAAYAVHRQHPRGWLDDTNAGWLIEILSVDNVVHTPLELEIVLHALDMAMSAPERLYAFALEQLRLGLAPDSRSAYALSRPCRSVGIDLADLHYLWRVIRSACDGGRLALSALERDILQAIDAIAEPAMHHAGWNSLIGSLRLRPEPRSGVRRTAWLKDFGPPALETPHQAA